MFSRTPVANLTFACTLKPVVNSLKQKRQVSAVLRIVFWSISSLLIANTVCQAQNIQHTENKPDLALRSDVRVDPSTLGMSFSIPLASYPGRAGHGLPVAITYSSKSLRLEFTGVDYTPITGAKTWTTVQFAEHSTAGWTSTLSPPRVEFTGMGQFFDGQGSQRLILDWILPTTRQSWVTLKRKPLFWTSSSLMRSVISILFIKWIPRCPV